MKQTRAKSIVAALTALFDLLLVIFGVTGMFEKWGITENQYIVITGAVITFVVNLFAIYNNPTNPQGY